VQEAFLFFLFTALFCALRFLFFITFLKTLENGIQIYKTANQNDFLGDRL